MPKIKNNSTLTANLWEIISKLNDILYRKALIVQRFVWHKILVLGNSLDYSSAVDSVDSVLPLHKTNGAVSFYAPRLKTQLLKIEQKNDHIHVPGHSYGHSSMSNVKDPIPHTRITEPKYSQLAMKRVTSTN